MGCHTLDKIIGDEAPVLESEQALRDLETVPFEERIAAASTYQALQLGAAVNPDAPALYYLQEGTPEEEPIVITFRQMMGRINQIANMLHELGVGPEDTVSFMLPLVPQAFMLLFAAEAVGIANPVNPMLEAEQITGILKAAKTKVLVALGPMPGTEIWRKAMAVRDSLPELKAVLQVGGDGDQEDGIHPFDAMADRQPADRLVSGRVIKPEDTAAYFHTGGTTGTPKLVRLTHRNQVYQAWGMGLFSMGRERGVGLLIGLPLFHVGGALTQGLNSLAAGMSLVVLTASGFRNATAVRNYWRLVEKYRPRTVSGVPTIFSAILSAPFEGCDLSSIKYVGGGGSAIPVEVGRALKEIVPVPVYEVYGMTETSSVHTLTLPDGPDRLGSVGFALPYSRVRVARLDEHEKFVRDCETDEIGVVIMEGPGVFSGYLNEEYNKNAFAMEGWVNSGDLGRIDGDGYLWITGRAKDTIIRGGHNIDPLTIEDVIYRHPAVNLAAAVGQPDGYAGELPVVYVQKNPGVEAEAQEILDFLRERIAERAANPVQLYFLDEMPLTLVGKVFRPQLRWDAARRVFSDLLAPLAIGGAVIEVRVGPHPTHGTMATVMVSGVAGEGRERTAAGIAEVMKPFVIRHRVEFL